MLASVYRLAKPRDISRVFSSGRFGSATGLTVKAASNRLPYSRLVIVVGKKVSKKAVIRNRIRRRISGELEAQWATVATGYDIVVSVRDDLSELAADELHERLIIALRRSRLIT